MARSRTVIIVGAGIGGLTLALTLAQRGLRPVVIEQAERLEEAGAGIQLSPNATRILLALGLGDKLAPLVARPEAIRVMNGKSGREIVRIPLGSTAELRFGAPYWVIHRADLQAVLSEAVRQSPDALLRLGAKVEDFAVHAHGVTVHARARNGTVDERGIALVAADGLWSTLRAKLGHQDTPVFARRTAWRAIVPVERAGGDIDPASTTLWLGPNTHLVHYPVKAGRAINLAAFMRDDWQKPGWGVAANASELLAHYGSWAAQPRALLEAPERWVKWALYDRPPARRWGTGRVTLLGDAAHPMLPFLAQGGAMAIEDAAVLAQCLDPDSDEPEPALRAYERSRQGRTARMQRGARRNGKYYHLTGSAALARNLMLRTIGGRGVLARYGWIYDWRAS